jgi:hypothetical protein
MEAARNSETLVNFYHATTQKTAIFKKLEYLDGTCIHLTHTVSECLQGSKTKGVMKNNCAGRRCIMVHGGSERGFVKAAYEIFKSKTNSGDYD